MVNFNATQEETNLIVKIAERAATMCEEAGVKYDGLTINMDLTAVHCNGCRLNLDGLLHADEFDFVHDILGIRRHLHRGTGLLEGCFMPRYAERNQ